MSVPAAKIRKTAYISSAILAGILVFLFQTCLSLSAVQLSNSFHKELFEKHSIYSHVSDVISSSMDSYLNSLKKSSPEEYSQHSEIFDMLNKSTTPDMISKNLDSISNGLFDYFTGKTSFLPDLYLNSQKVSSNGYIQKDPSAIAGIGKINLNAVLLYINRNDIVNYLAFIRFVYYAVKQVENLSLMFLIFAVIIAVVLCKKALELLKWFGIALTVYGILSLLSGISLFIFKNLILPSGISPIAMSLPLPRDVILSYIRDCLTPAIIIMSGAAVICFVIWAALRKITGNFSRPAVPENIENKYTPSSNRILKVTVFSLICVLMASITFFKVHTITRDFESNDFSSVIYKIRNVSTSTKVIAASGDTIYMLQINLVDQNDNKPVPNTKINISGKSSVNNQTYNETGKTDFSGIAKFYPDKGSYYLSFLTEDFPSQFVMPSPVFIELKTAGTTIMTVNLKPNEIDNPLSSGIIEVEVLDSRNKPISGIELSINNPAPSLGHPDAVHAYTDSSGIAVFKISEGSYRAFFEEAKLPSKYALPAQIDVSVKADETTRYEIRLSNK
ncbi:MAG: hypothetical protein Q8920_15980 [Bacillota bacterium]|nr:hypothetical protein [Bacillota bacterium]